MCACTPPGPKSRRRCHVTCVLVCAHACTHTCTHVCMHAAPGPHVVGELLLFVLTYLLTYLLTWPPCRRRASPLGHQTGSPSVARAACTRDRHLHASCGRRTCCLSHETPNRTLLVRTACPTKEASAVRSSHHSRALGGCRRKCRLGRDWKGPTPSLGCSRVKRRGLDGVSGRRCVRLHQPQCTTA